MEYFNFNGDNPISELINGRVNAMDTDNNYKIKIAVDKATEHQ